MMVFCDILAQQRFSNEIFVWLGVIVAAGVLLGLIAAWLRRRLVAEPPPMKLGFTLEDLREMHAQGQLDDDEFESAKAKMLAKSRRDLSEEAQAKREKRGYPEHPSPKPLDGSEEEVQDLGDLSEPGSEPGDGPTDPGEDVDKG